jgi:AraC-like DNA-binding protein
MESWNDIEESEGQKAKKYAIRNLYTRSCSLLLQEKIEHLGLRVFKISPGCFTLSPPSKEQEKQLEELLEKYGFEILFDKDQILVEQIKQAVIELIHEMNNSNSVVRKSDYLVSKLNKSYAYLSRVFSAIEHITLEKYIILQKIERIKQLIDQNEYSLSEIAYLMDYNSVQYLSNQFHKITGQTVSQYKKSHHKNKHFWDDL